MKPTPETTSQFNRPHPAHRLTVTTAAVAAGTTGFGSGCNLPQSSRLFTTPFLTRTVLLLPVLLLQTLLLPLLQQMLPVPLTYKSALPILIFNPPSWLSPYPWPSKLTCPPFSCTLLVFLQRTAATPLITQFLLLDGEMTRPMETTGLLKTHGALLGATTATF